MAKNIPAERRLKTWTNKGNDNFRNDFCYKISLDFMKHDSLAPKGLNKTMGRDGSQGTHT